MPPKAKAVHKMTYRYDFTTKELTPLLETHVLAEKDDVIQNLANVKPMTEPIEKQEKDVSLSLAEVQESVNRQSYSNRTTLSKHQKQDSLSFVITYYNPAMKKAEVLATTSDIKTTDYVQKTIEEAAGMASGYSIYSFVVSPILITQVDEDRLRRILEEREYGTPPDFGSAPLVKVRTEQKKSTIVAVDAKEALKAAIIRKERAEEKLTEEILLIEDAIKGIDAGKAVEDAIKKLGPVSRARFLIALKQKKVSKNIVMRLLERDVKFLKSIKKRLEEMSTEDLLDIIRIIRKLKE